MSDASHVARSPLWTGRLEGISPAEVIWEICRGERTGVLRVVRHPVQRELYIQDGQILFVTSSDPNDRIGERLLRQRKITLDQLEVALGQSRSGKRLGTLLVEAGALTAEELVTAVVCQLKANALAAIGWERGDYVFREGPLPTEETITLQLPTPALLLHGLRNLRSVSRIRRRVGPPRSPYGLCSGGAALLDGLILTEGERLLLQRLETGPATIAELCRHLVVSSWEVYTAVHALRVLGVVEPFEILAAEQPSTDHEGSLVRRSLPELLVGIHRSEQGGILQLHRDGVERRLHFEGGRCVFATSNDPDDGLLHSLFRRGVISLNDKEETAQRLLSNKRTGQILRDLGVLDDRDLHEAVRRQVSEIILDSFEWTDGEYLFVPGLLPTSEGIRLDLDPASLIYEGIRRVSSWTQVIQGCGGVDNPLTLAPQHVAVLDAMGAGSDEWQVVDALRSPCTPRRICRTSELDDFRVCQILWALRLLGAVENLSAEAADAAAATEDQEAIALPGEPPWDDVRAPDPCPELRSELLELAERTHGEGGRAVDAPPAHVEPEWEGPPDLEDVVHRFNAMHRVVYRAVRSEIGAGAVNFVHSCCERVGPQCSEALAGVDLHSDGSWDAEALKRVVRFKHIENPWPVYQMMLDQIYLQLRPHLGEARAEELKERILGLAAAAAPGSLGDQSGSR